MGASKPDDELSTGRVGAYAQGAAVSDDAIQDLIDELARTPVDLGIGPPNGEDRMSWGLASFNRARHQHTANRDTIASLRSSLEGRAAEVARLQAKVARLESAIADHVIEDTRLNRALEETEAHLYGPPNPSSAAFLGKLKVGGLIVSTSVLVPMEIVIATAEDRLFVDRDGFGFVYVGAQIAPEWVARKFGGTNGQ